MKCPLCGKDNPPGAVFCGVCGAQMPTGGVASEPRPIIATEPGPRVDERKIPPQDLGGLVGATFDAYRADLWPILGIAAVPQAAFVSAGILAATGGTFAAVLLGIAGAALYLLAGPAIAFGVAQQALGRGVRVDECIGRSLQSAFPLIGGAFILVLALALPSLLSVILIGIPLVMFLAVNWLFFSHSIILEGMGPVESLSKSWSLVKGEWWRVFGIFVVFALITSALSAPIAVAGFVATLVSQTAGTVIAAAGNALVFPVSLIGATMLYLDLRARKEGLTLEALASGMGVGPSVARHGSGVSWGGR